MNQNRFDAFSRELSSGTTRRRFSALLLGLGFGSAAGLTLLGGSETEAKNKAKRRKHKKRKNRKEDQPQPQPQPQPENPTCVPTCEGKNCGPDGCGGVCGVCVPPLIACSSETQTCGTIIPPL